MSHTGVDPAHGHPALATELRLWRRASDGRHTGQEDLYLANQDDGTFGTLNGGATSVSWNTENCCDGFAAKGDSTRALTTVCCFSPGRATRLFVSAPGLTVGGSPPQINTYPAGNVRSFEQLESLLTYSANAYAMSTT